MPGVEPDNQRALVTLLLALTDRYGRGFAVSGTQAEQIVKKLADGYEQAYYSGLIGERKAKAQLAHGAPGSGFNAHDLITKAMQHYEKAEALRPAGNDDALLRFNACARIMMKNNLTARPQENYEPALE
ncbi:MAG: hypothetical protein FJ386_02150 [Verrucomicrobia bacterium]|nr:hypothetical protein [Verrucomicrobiota bacterium]